MKKNIADLLGNMTEKPSAHCWESIEQQLPSVSSPGNASGNSSSQSILSKTSRFIAQKSAAFWGKVAIISFFSATVATLAAVLITGNLQNKEVAKPETSTILQDDKPVILVDSMFQDTVLQEELIVEQPVSEPKEITSVRVSQQEKEVLSTPQPPVISKEEQVAVPQSTPVSFPVVPTIEPLQEAEQSEPLSDPISQSGYESKIIVQDIKNDPLLQQNESDEEFGYDKPIKLTIPNVITPNGDGVNDYFVIEGIEHCDKSELIIREKSGTIVFRSKSYQNNWGGDDVRVGLYYYSFLYVMQGIEEVRQGTITVLR